MRRLRWASLRWFCSAGLSAPRSPDTTATTTSSPAAGLAECASTARTAGRQWIRSRSMMSTFTSTRHCMKLVDGWYFPDHEQHLLEWMMDKNNRVQINGRSSYQGKKQLAAVELC